MKLFRPAFVVLVSLLSTSAHGETIRSSWVEALDGKVKCIWARDRIVTVRSGPCKNFVPPRQVRMGETFQANGKIKTIGIVTASRMDKDIPQLGLKSGDWTCTAAESPSDIPEFSGKRDHTGTWLYVAKCKPLE